MPLLAMNTLDDVLIPPHLVNHAIEAGASNPNVFAVVTKIGGHLAWLTGWRGRSWQVMRSRVEVPAPGCLDFTRGEIRSPGGNQSPPSGDLTPCPPRPRQDDVIMRYLQIFFSTTRPTATTTER